MKMLKLRRNKLDDDKAASLSTCVHNVDELNLQDCELTTRGVKKLSNAIKLRSNAV